MAHSLLDNGIMENGTILSHNNKCDEASKEGVKLMVQDRTTPTKIEIEIQQIETINNEHETTTYLVFDNGNNKRDKASN